MTINSDGLTEAWRAAQVKRWHVEHTIGEQRVNGHTFGVMLIILLLHPEPTVNLLRGAAYHDLGEWYAGDSPITAKGYPAFRVLLNELELVGCEALMLKPIHPALTDEETWWIRGADMLEALLYVEYERDLGNKILPLVAFSRIREWFTKKGHHLPTPIVQQFNHRLYT